MTKGQDQDISKFGFIRNPFLVCAWLWSFYISTQSFFPLCVCLNPNLFLLGNHSQWTILSLMNPCNHNYLKALKPFWDTETWISGCRFGKTLFNLQQRSSHLYFALACFKIKSMILLYNIYLVRSRDYIYYINKLHLISKQFQNEKLCVLCHIWE